MDPSLRTLIEQAEFKESFRGYDRAQVDDTLEQLASRAGKLESDLAEAARRLDDAETRIRAEAEAELEAQGRSKPAASRVAPVRNEEADAEEVRLTLVMAQRTADAAVAEARVQAEKLLDEARTDALRTTADARSESTRERQEGRKRLADEIKDLETVRTVLQGDIELMRAHVKSEREQLSNALDRLRELLKDPAAFRTAPAPVPTPVVVPEPPPEPAAVDAAAPEPMPAKASPTAPAPAPRGAAPSAPPAPGAKGGPSRPNDARGAGVSGGKAPVDQIAPGVTDAGGATNGDTAPAGAKEVPAATLSVDVAQEEDAFLSELRKAMTDDEQPRGAAANPSGRSADQSRLQSGGPNAGPSDADKPRFGRRK